MKLLFALTLMALTSGCLYVAPIEEDHTKLSIMEVNEEQGVMLIDLSNTMEERNPKFEIRSLEGGDQEQPLYSRIVIDYRLAGVESLPIEATVPRSSTKNNRNNLAYQLRPCKLKVSHDNVFEAGKSIVLYLVVADEPFKYSDESFTSLVKPFETENDRSVYAQWTLQFKGKCP